MLKKSRGGLLSESWRRVWLRHEHDVDGRPHVGARGRIERRGGRVFEDPKSVLKNRHDDLRARIRDPG